MFIANYVRTLFRRLFGLAKWIIPTMALWVLFSSTTFAATCTWTGAWVSSGGGGNNWTYVKAGNNDPLLNTNWNCGYTDPTPNIPQAGDILQFPAVGVVNTSPNNDYANDTVFSKIIITGVNVNQALTMTGNRIHLSSQDAITYNHQNFNGLLTFTFPITYDDANPIVLVESNRLTLNGTQTLTGNGNITFTGSSLNSSRIYVGGAITGDGGVIKTGTGEVHFLNSNAGNVFPANSYTGSTTVSGGNLYIDSSENIPDSSAVTVNAGGILRTPNGETIASLTGAGNAQGGLTVGGNNQSTTFSGVANTIHKVGNGTLNMTGTVGSGSIDVQSGVLNLSGNTNNIFEIDIANGATLDISNTANLDNYDGDNNLASADIFSTGGTFSIGAHGTGNVRGGGLSLDAASTFVVNIAGSTDGEFSHYTNNSADFTGSSIILDGTLDVNLLNGYVPDSGTPLTIIQNESINGSTIGSFSNLPNDGDTILADGVTFAIQYHGGVNFNDVILTPVGLAITANDGHDSPADPVTIGQALTYTVTVTNSSLAAVQGVTVADNAPAGLTGMSWTCGVVGGGSCSSGAGAGHLTGVTVDLDPGDVATFTVSATVANGAASDINYTATLEPPMGFSDGNSNDNSATDTDFVRARLTEVHPVNPSSSNTEPFFTLGSTQDGTITSVTGGCSVSNPNVVAGDNLITFDTLAVANGYVCKITIQDTAHGLDSNELTLTSFDITDAPMNTDVDISVSNGDSVVNVSVNQPLTYLVAVTNNSGVTVNGITLTDTFPVELTNIAWSCAISSGVGSCVHNAGVDTLNAESISLNAGAVATFTVTADVSAVAASNIVTTAAVSMPINYTNTNIDNGTSADTDYVRAVISEFAAVAASSDDTTPSFTLSSTQAGLITAVGGGCAITNPPAIVAGDNNVLTFDALVPNTYHCTITIQDETNHLDSNTLALTVFEITAPPPPSDVDVDIAVHNTDNQAVVPDDQNIVLGNQALTYLVTVTNNSGVTVNGIVVTDIFPGSLTNVSWTCAISSGVGSCDTEDGVGDINAVSVNLNAAAVATFTITADVSNAAAANIVTTASVAMPDGYVNTNVNNGTSVDTDQVRARLAQVTPVFTPSENRTPTYVFSSTQAGTITYDGSCSSANVLAQIGENQVTFNLLPAGVTYNNCTIMIHDITHNNASNTLNVPSFTITVPAAPAGGGGGGGGGGGWWFIPPPKSNDQPKQDVVQSKPEDLKTPSQQFFQDVQDHWSRDYVNKIHDKCRINGYQDAQGNSLHTFNPDTHILRAEFVTIFMQCKFPNLPAVTGNIPYPDVAHDAWYAPAIAKAKELGWVTGYDDGKFYPLREINRAEAAKILVLSETQFNDIPNAAPSPAFLDMASLKPYPWYYRYVAFAVQKGLFSGYVDGNGKATGMFGPANMLLRGEAAKIISNLFKL